ncbi:MAG: hypothetical protein ACAH80_01570 [Alphaproteobacteria bacterium]
MTDPVVKTFAQFDTSSYGRGPAVEITDVKQAVDYGIKNNCSRFRIYEQTSVTIGGKTLAGDPEYKPGTYNLFVDKMMTAADIVAFYEQKIAEDKAGKGNTRSSGFMADIDRQVNKQMRDQFKSYPADQPFYDDPFGRGQEYSSVGPDDVIFNRKGEQLWPVPTPSVATDHKVAPMKKISLKPPKP